MFSSIVRCALATLVAALAVAPPPLAPSDEVRALWVVRTTLTSPAAVRAMVASARDSGFNTLLVQVRGRGDAYFQGGVEPRPPALVTQATFDPLATAIDSAHAAGLQVHAWLNVNLVAGPDLPSSREHVVYRHPEWLMVPRALADDLAAVDVRSPEYLGRLARYTRSRPNELEGLYVSPVDPAAAAYTTAVIRDVAERYAVDGVHLDYIRYPEDDFDYGRDTLDAFRRSVLTDLKQGEERRYDNRLGGEPLVYTRAFPDRWRAFRAARLTELLSRVRAAVKEARPSAVVSAAVVPNADDAVVHRLQDWRTWVARDLVDVICPMAYTTDAATFANQISSVRLAANTHPVWAGIGAYRLSPAQIVDNVQTARRLGAGGVILFSYDSLADPARGPDYLGRIARAAFQF